jgi:hypothetical protein
MEKARKEDVVIQTADGAQFLLTAIQEFDREIAATRRNQKLMTYLDECARATDLIPIQTVREELGLPRNSESRNKAKSIQRRKK